jgi:hypothetical protein
MFDIVINFRTAYRDEVGDLVTNPKKIAKHYLKSWFAIDVAACFPVTYIILLIDATGSTPGAQGNSQGGAKNLKALKIVRLLRLAKMLRLARLKRLLKRLDEDLPGIWTVRFPTPLPVRIHTVCVRRILQGGVIYGMHIPMRYVLYMHTVSYSKRCLETLPVFLLSFTHPWLSESLKHLPHAGLTGHRPPSCSRWCSSFSTLRTYAPASGTTWGSNSSCFLPQTATHNARTW